MSHLLTTRMLRAVTPSAVLGTAADVTKQLAVVAAVGAVAYLPGIGDRDDLRRAAAFRVAAVVCFVLSVVFKGGAR